MRSLLLLLACLVSLPVEASHIFGGEITYRYLGLSAPTTARYEVTLTLYEDCLEGLSAAIAQDDPEYINFFDNAGHPLFVDVDGYSYYDSMLLVSRTTIISSSADICYMPPALTHPPAVCLQKAVFRKNFDLPVVSTPGATYTAVVQRCCLNTTAVNIDFSASTGLTFYATIPADNTTNKAATFKSDPLYYIRINTPLVYDASATDANGDSLSYEFCTAYKGGSNNDAKPIPTHPPFTPVVYTAPFSYSHPITSSPQIQIDPVTGIITGTPTVMGRYVVLICCHEWRNGVNINTTSRETQFFVTNCIHGVGLPGLTTAQEKLNVFVSLLPSMATISFAEGAGNIAIIDMFGRVVYRSEITNDQNNVKIPTESWSKGIYIVRLTYPEIGNISTKFVLD